MNANEPEAPTPRPPLAEPTTKPPSDGWVALRAFVGLATYFGVGWMSLASRSRVGLGPVGLLVFVATILAVLRVWRGFALGVFIGVGLTLLLIGACFAMMSKI